MGEPFLQLPIKQLLTSKKRRDSEDKMREDGLPVTDAELITTCEHEYEDAAQHGGQPAQDACFRLAWALVHSSEERHVARGVELAEALAHGEGLEQRDVLYLQAVGRYRQRRYIESRRMLKSLLETHPDFRQAETLLEACDKEILKDGLVGLGAGAAIVGAVAAIAIAALRR
ncbi:mitochondrial fission 1 A [Micractinium conductrix]|uniref:Mitochondrial fission 1 A n=1 Tax=Micractinium conductrix TaxID=554055 RepID=A0A2P6V1M9_9CHLO|nr:mitochondrial fission 1 A [Micractinium conductrix]|eukprot:PSC68001.1 mitochondrial fission 1 A [Micractinium conductrix]